MPQTTSLPKIMQIDEEKCTNCHKCISVCPVKYCNDGSGKIVQLNHDTCIGCGNCIVACEHIARVGIDDTDAFLNDLRKGVRMVAIVAPSAAVSFPCQSLNLNGWLRSIGVKACFDVSFGAELTVKSYVEHMAAETPETLIAQPCPAIVSYIEIYRPELIPYLAPADSPMLHTAKMIKEYYKQLGDHKIAAISPCYAKKREFAAAGLVDYNVTMLSLNRYMLKNEIFLGEFPAIDYDNPPAERAALFPMPGGLLHTVERWIPNVSRSTRKIEGTGIIYNYLSSLKFAIDDGKSPALIDCLNCDMGCNGGPGTLCHGLPLDEVEFLVKSRNRELRARHRKAGPFSEWRTHRTINKMLNKYWKDGLYRRSYTDRQANNSMLMPENKEIAKIFDLMRKRTRMDECNCMACGYGSCRDMAIAIYNRLNRPENCTKYKEMMIELKNEELSKLVNQLRGLSETDALTSLLNRRKFNEVIKLEWNRAIRNETSLVLIFIDVDFFKNYNDTYGHLKGDDCLIAVSNTLKEKFKRANEFVARYGGEEFAIIMTHSDTEEGIAACERLIESISALGIPHSKSKVADHVTISAGMIVSEPSEGDRLEDFINDADQALYKAKESGRNRYEVA